MFNDYLHRNNNIIDGTIHDLILSFIAFVSLRPVKIYKYKLIVDIMHRYFGNKMVDLNSK